MKKIYAKYLLVLLMFLFAQTCCVAKNIRLAQVTDVHYSSEKPETGVVLQNAIESLNSEKDLEFVVFTGDNTDKSNQKDLIKFVEELKDLKHPYYIVLGNHDVFKSNGIPKKEYYKIIRQINPKYPQKTPNYAFEKNGYKFLIVDGAKEVIPGSNGYYREETLAWVKKELDKAKRQNVVIFQHFPLVYPTNSMGRLKTHYTYKGEEYLALLKNYSNVLAIVSGHFHSNWEGESAGMYHISTPSLQGQPHSYKIIDIIDDEKGGKPMIFTALKEF